MTSRAGSNRRQRGFSMVELGLSIVIMAAGGIALMTAVSKQAASIRDRSVAQNLQTIVDAERAYVKANYSSLVGSATSGAPIVINITGAASGSFQSVQTAGFLPGSFVNKNAYGQSAVMLVRQPVAGQLEVVTTTLGGAKIPDENLGNIAQLVGSAGGFMAQKPVAASTGYITGAFGGWKTLASTWTNGSNAPTVGHAMATLAFDSSTAPGQYLSRVATGTPSDNQMSTAIDMNGNDLKNAKAITATTVTASGAITGASLTATGAVTAASATISGALSANTVSALSMSALTVSATLGMSAPAFSDSDNSYYFLDPSQTSRVNSIYALGMIHTADQVWAEGNIGGNKDLTINGNAYIDGMVQGLLTATHSGAAGGTCTPNGGIFAVGTGQLLNCVSGKLRLMTIQ